MEHSPINDGSASSTRQITTTITRTQNSGPSDRNFEQKLIEIGVFYVDDDLPVRAGPLPTPRNFEELQERVLRPRPSLSLARFTDTDYQAIIHSFKTSETEKDIMRHVIPKIEGSSQGRGRNYANKLFNNL